MLTETRLHPLPAGMIESHRRWRERIFNPEDFANLATAQQPPAMVISCCDSRVDPSKVFDAAPGTIFTLRNIANLVPPPAAKIHSVLAAVEFAVLVLKIRHLIVKGHSNCGGVHHGYHIHNGTSDLAPDSSVYGWLKHMGEAYARLEKTGDDEANIAALEKTSVLASLKNLAEYTPVAGAMQSGALQLHGMWHEIPTGKAHAYNPASGDFEALL